MKKKAPRRQKHIPQRTCIICREKKDKRELIRIVNHAEDGFVIDVTGKKNGRGAYLCTASTCWDRMKHSQILDKALRAEISQAAKEALSAQFSATTTVGE
ncbi:MAG: YlxR family protein [Chloroflexota bacterium]